MADIEDRLSTICSGRELQKIEVLTVDKKRDIETFQIKARSTKQLPFDELKMSHRFWPDIESC